LKLQFDWLADGELQFLIEKNLTKEIRLLEKYLRDLRNPEIVEIIDKGIEMGHDYYSDYGNLMRNISVLRAADSLWSTTSSCGMIRLGEEGLKSASPQILVVLSERYGTVRIILFKFFRSILCSSFLKC
jgi:hypothetical protein